MNDFDFNYERDLDRARCNFVMAAIDYFDILGLADKYSFSEKNINDCFLRMKEKEFKIVDEALNNIITPR